VTRLEEDVRELVLRLVREDSELRREIAALAGVADALLTIGAAAELAGVAAATLRRWIRLGGLPATGTHKRTRIRRRDLHRYLERGGRREVELSPEALADLEDGVRP
jgi:excisionase family DNA binding protein